MIPQSPGSRPRQRSVSGQHGSWVYFRLNRLEEAEHNLRQSIEKINGDPTVYDHLGDVYLKEGKIKEAIAQWQLSLKEWQKHSRPRWNRTKWRKSH